MINNYSKNRKCAWLSLTLWFIFCGIFTKVSAQSISNNSSEQPKIDVELIILDIEGSPVIGATAFLVSELTNADISDVSGTVILKNVPSNGEIAVSYIGMAPQKISVNGRKNINVIMVEDAKAIDDVVVVGYGKQRRSGIVSSINTVTAKEIKMPTRSLTNNIAGQVAGVIAIQRTGQPGADDSDVYVRGRSSYMSAGAPLILVDGVPRKMSDVGVDEIETFTVLKDAAATAVYGAEGANGVILITTRRGMVGKSVISFSAEYSILQPTRLPKFMNSVDYMNTFNDARWNEGLADEWSPELIAKYADRVDPELYPDTNWLDMLRNFTNNQRYSISFRGGNKVARYFVSGSYYEEDGIFKNENTDYNANIGLKRFNIRSNVDIDVTKSTLLSVNLSGQYLQTNYPGSTVSDIFGSMTTIPPYLIPFVYSDGTIPGHPRPSYERVNPYNQLMNSGYQKEQNPMFQSKVELTQKLDFITSGLSVRGSMSFDAIMKFTVQRLKTPTQYYMTGRDGSGAPIYKEVVAGSDVLSENVSGGGSKSIYIDASANYDRVFANVHYLTGMMVYMQKETQQANSAIAYRKQGLVGRVSYGYDNRYNIEGSFGYTGSEAFAEGHRFGLFPAVGASYTITNEKFIKETKFTEIVSRLRLRVSYGITGNDNVGRFLYRGTMNQYAPGGFELGWGASGGLNELDRGLAQARFPAPTLGWEIEKKRNYGIDLALFGNKFDITFDYFDNFRENILIRRRTVSGATGFNEQPLQNFGQVANKGFDASAAYHQMFGDFRISARVNVTFARNKIIEYDEIPQKYDWMNMTGTRIGEQYALIADGFYTYDDFTITGEGRNRQYTLKDGVVGSELSGNLRPGDLKYKDINGDGTISKYDYVRQGDPAVPELVYGFGFNFEYKGFYANIFFQGVGKTSVFLPGANTAGFFPFSKGFDQSNIRTVVANRWTDRGPNDELIVPAAYSPDVFPRLRTNKFAHNEAVSTHWIRDASFIRLKNIEFGYRFPKSLLSKIGLNSGRIFVQGYNIAVWDNIKMWDPETGGTNAGLTYPLPRTFTIGLEVSL